MIGEGKPGFLEHFDEKKIRAFYAIRTIMKELADEDNLVIVGRGAHHELKNYTSIIKVRIIADKETRIKNLMDEKGLDEGEAKKLIKQNDKQQSEYIKYFFFAKHSDEEHYDLIINSSRISHSACAGVIIQVAREVGAMRIIPQE
jgi:cytidylate kinase